MELQLQRLLGPGELGISSADDGGLPTAARKLYQIWVQSGPSAVADCADRKKRRRHIVPIGYSDFV